MQENSEIRNENEYFYEIVAASEDSTWKYTACLFITNINSRYFNRENVNGTE